MTTRAVAARTGADAYRDLSLWHEQYPGSWEPRAGLPGDLSLDVAVVGAGYTGLWTAYALAVAASVDLAHGSFVSRPARASGGDERRWCPIVPSGCGSVNGHQELPGDGHEICPLVVVRTAR